MNPGIAQGRSSLGAEEGGLFAGPAEAASEEGHGESLEPLVEVGVVPGADLLVMGVPGPSADGPFELPLDNVDEAGPLHVGLVGGRDGEGAAELGAGLCEGLTQLVSDGILSEGAVVGEEGTVDVLHLEVAAGL